jgi:ribonuclease E
VTAGVAARGRPKDLRLADLMTERFEADLEAVARTAAWCGEPLLHDGEDPAVALAPGTVRRAALDAALEEMRRGELAPSFQWRRDYALVLGLERVLSEPQPKLASGTTLRRHQVDALAGQLAALIGDLLRPEEPTEDEEEDDEENGAIEAEAVLEGSVVEEGEDGEDDDLEDDEDDDLDGDSEQGTGEDVSLDSAPDPTVAAVSEVDDEEGNGETPPDPGARRRYRFKHPTASGKTIAAAGFVEAARTTGVLILTHRRLLVDQFTRDLTHEGYGGRLHPPVLRGDPIPEVPPLTINTYSWFIKHSAELRTDVYGVVVCDEAHTALGEKTAAAIRAFNEPVYIGMTATDQLLAKHVGDVFPAEVADFPLAEAVRRGVVAPLRCVRVRPIASLRNVEIVGGDYDQSQLAAALDLDPLNLAASDLYQSRFGDTPGIVYAAGVDHAERVAAAMRAIGLAAAAVSGRTPPRDLAETLAAYDRGDINVLVNAQILAEGWNAPRATVCMHLAPTASRRVYQQRVGRIMRLHRRKEAGIVVDFAEPGAPHTERTVTLHSLLGVDAYRPGALVTPPPPRRRRRRKPPRPIIKEASWMVPVSDDPERRIAVIANQWKLVDASKLALDEQRAWAVVAARSVTPADVHQLAERITALQREARELFLFTCSAENKHRRLRLTALGDLVSQRPSQTTFAMACRLVEAAPPWQQDRGQGARVLLLAIGDGKIDAPADRLVTWTWQLAKAARDHQYRYAGSHIPDGRSLLGALAGAGSDPAHTEAAVRLATVARSAPLEAGAALLAVASPRRGSAAERMIELARRELSADPLRLAAALGSNIPAPIARSKASKRAKRKAEIERGQTVSFNGAVVGSTPPAVPILRRPDGPEIEVAPEVAVRLRDDAGAVVAERVGGEQPVSWRLPGSDQRLASAVEVRQAAAEIAPLQVSVPKLLNDPSRSDRVARVDVDGAGLVVALEPAEAEVLADDAARRVLAQLKGAGVRGRVRVEFAVTSPDGERVRDSRPGAVRKIARGEPVGASSDRRDRRRRGRGKRRRAAAEVASANGAADGASAKLPEPAAVDPVAEAKA